MGYDLEGIGGSCGTRVCRGIEVSGGDSSSSSSSSRHGGVNDGALMGERW